MRAERAKSQKARKKPKSALSRAQEAKKRASRAKVQMPLQKKPSKPFQKPIFIQGIQVSYSESM